MIVFKVIVENSSGKLLLNIAFFILVADDDCLRYVLMIFVEDMYYRYLMKIIFEDIC